MKTYRQLINEWKTPSQKPLLRKKRDIVVTSVSQMNKKNMSKKPFSSKFSDPKFLYAAAIAQAARPGPEKRKSYWNRIANNVVKVRQLIRIRRP